MDKLEWTLSARVNNKDTTTSTSSSNASEPAAVTPTKAQSGEQTATETDSPLPPFPITDYFCVTAPVAHPNTKLNDENSLHYVVKYTPTVIVDLRYKFSVTKFPVRRCDSDCYIPSQDLMNDIAEKVHEIVTSTLNINDPKQYRYYTYMQVCIIGIGSRGAPGAGAPLFQSPTNLYCQLLSWKVASGMSTKVVPPLSENIFLHPCAFIVCKT